MKKILNLICLLYIIVSSLSAKEGMWLPVLLEKYNIAEMQEMGFKLTANDIYDINNASMKDAIVLFGSGCTGAMISDEGLLITNHHCGMRYIQTHSSVEHNYLENGFWAMSRKEELPNQGLKVHFLEYMKDVTDNVLVGTKGLLEEELEKNKENSGQIIAEADEEGKYEANIKPLFYGSQYYLYVYKVYRDVRLVGAPPSAIGKFGGDTDNWMWPRHTGDFSLFRIYADKNNEPADFSADNIPFKPKKFFTISMKGVQQDDFSMVLGYPGSTQQYIPSQQVDIIKNQRDPERIKIRDKKLEIIGSAMEKDPKIRIQYAAKYASISNAWKKWQGEKKGLEQLDASKRKKFFESEFKKWAKNNGTWENNYKDIFESFDHLYELYSKYIHASDYYSEIVLNGVEIFRVAKQINSIINYIENKQTDRLEKRKESVVRYLTGFFKDYNQSIDETLFVELIPMLASDVDENFLPVEFIQQINKYDKKKLLNKVYRKSFFIDHEKLKEILISGNDQQLLKLRKDPLFSIFNKLNFYDEVHIQPALKNINQAIERNMKRYVDGIIKMNSENARYPDANLTLRVSYGKVEGYEPMDGVNYKYYSTLSGIMEKDDQEVGEYHVPERLKELFYTKDYGKYGSSGELNVCFTSSNHTTGGNSGSPIMNANGELVGINFDRCWEGTMSDIMYDPDLCRNIAVDIRYVLFIIDKYAGAGYLQEEMEFAD